MENAILEALVEDRPFTDLESLSAAIAKSSFYSSRLRSEIFKQLGPYGLAVLNVLKSGR